MFVQNARYAAYKSVRALQLGASNDDASLKDEDVDALTIKYPIVKKGSVLDWHRTEQAKSRRKWPIAAPSWVDTVERNT